MEKMEVFSYSFKENEKNKIESKLRFFSISSIDPTPVDKFPIAGNKRTANRNLIVRIRSHRAARRSRLPARSVLLPLAEIAPGDPHPCGVSWNK